MYNILCVDDTQSNLLVLESLFEVYGNRYNLITANGGYEALEILLKTQIDLILFDVMMPDIDGFETASLIKSHNQTKNIPIIFLTAKKDDVTIKNAFKYGVDYLSKPYNEFELFTRINVQLELVCVNNKLDEQIKFNQSVMNSQRNILFIQNDNGLISANQSFLEFFNVVDIEQFNKQHKCISELFMEYDNYFSLHVLNDGNTWTDILSASHLDEEYNILVMDTHLFEPKAFRIEVNGIDDSDKFVVILTDITKITTKSKLFENKATYDALTNIFNRSKFNDIFDLEVKTAKEDNHPLCFAIMDIDFFKKVNDNYGHIIGDETLITFANTIQNNIRQSDTFARWGGEEFVLSLPGVDLESALKVVDNLRKKIEETSFKMIGSITCSIGLTKVKKDDTVDNILIRSDEALYEAKESGRNKVCVK
jgi:diguanylate cyclase (GGDEF)-like protein